MTVSRSTQIDAPALEVWALISDLPGMGRLSPESTGGSWLKGATGPAVGARFKGANRNGIRRWSTTATVTTCEPGRAFAFSISYLGIPVSTWTYALEGDTTVTETWADHRPHWFAVVSGLATGVRDRSDATTAVNLEATLAALKRLAESPV